MREHIRRQARHSFHRNIVKRIKRIEQELIEKTNDA